MQGRSNVRAESNSLRYILVVDDSATVRRLVTIALERQGYQIACAADGFEALSKINDRLPDLILLDIAMPKLDGYQVCKVIRTNDESKHIPVVMLSGKGGFFDKVKGRMAGATAYITKPFEAEVLISTIKKYLH